MHIDVAATRRGLGTYLRIKRALCASDADFLAQLLKHRMLLPVAWAAPADQAIGLTLNMLVKQLAHDLQPAAALVSAANTCLAALGQAGCVPIVLKGHAFAQTFYPEPALRRSTDDDILIAPQDRLRGHQALLGLGYAARTFGALHQICGQAVYTKRIGESLHMVDLHWQLGNTFAFFDRFSFDTLRADAIAIPGHSIKGLQLAPWHAMVHAAMHYFTEPLEWERADIVLLDVAVIAQSLDPQQWQRACQAAHGADLSATVAAALQRAVKLFDLVVPAGIFETLAAGARSELPASLLRTRPARDSVFAPLRSGRSLRAKFTYAWYQLLPPAAYMRANYALSDGTPALLRAYGARLLKGARYFLPV